MKYFKPVSHYKTEAEIRQNEREKVLAQFMQYATSEDCPPGAECPLSKTDDVWICIKCIIHHLRKEGGA